MTHAAARDEAKLWRADALGGVELLRARFVEFCFPAHAHEEFMIAVTESGRALPWYCGGTHSHGAGDMIVLNPGEAHGGGPASGSPWEFRALYPSVALMQRAALERAGRHGALVAFTEPVVRDPVAAAAVHRAHAALERPSSSLERESRLLYALGYLIARHALQGAPTRRIGSEHRAVRRAREFLHAHPSENISLDALARAAGLSAFHLCRVFHAQTGLSPHAYQTMVRVRLAKALLSRGTPIAQAAAEAGFCDQAHLTRHFKRVYGVTPGRYATCLRGS